MHSIFLLQVQLSGVVFLCELVLCLASYKRIHYSFMIVASMVVAIRKTLGMLTLRPLLSCLHIATLEKNVHIESYTVSFRFPEYLSSVFT